jgi:hydroxymethylglutaryl-CoA reductase (NADPH)
MNQHFYIPTNNIGPIKISGSEVNDEIEVPITTFESTLIPSLNRGAMVSRLIEGGCKTIITSDNMTRSIALEAKDAQSANESMVAIKERFGELKEIVRQTSNFAKLIDLNSWIVGKLIYVRFSFSTGDAAGHNMTTKASDALLEWIISHYPLSHVSVSGNMCTDKKASAVNGILGRGKCVVSEAIISRKICSRVLKSTPEKINDLNIKKNLVGSIMSGGVRTGNAHFANMLLGAYLATGQDGANIVEGSQGITYSEVTANGDLYFSTTIPNIIVGTVGNGKHFPHIKDNLEKLGCLEKRNIGGNSRRLAIIIGATVLCGELSLMAAQTNQGELMKSHIKFER